MPPGEGQTASRCSGGTEDGYSCSLQTDCPGGFCNANYQSYLGTLSLKAGDAICGTYAITFDETTSFIANGGAPGTDGSMSPATEGLTLTTGLPCTDTRGSCCTETSYGPLCSRSCEEDCTDSNQQFGGVGSTCDTFDPPCTLLTSPPNCAIDARRPYPPNAPGQREGFTSFTWFFQDPPGSGENSASDFRLRQVPSDSPPVPPAISSVSFEPGNAVVLHFSAPIQPNKWTCITHFASGFEKCLGFLPGDADGSRAVGAGDIIMIIDNLNDLLIPPLTKYQCDINRSGICAPSDIITEIDLLNGASGFPRQNGKTLEACPSR